MDYKGTIIEESLQDKNVLSAVEVLSTKVEPVTAEHKTPWLKQWTLHKVVIQEARAELVAEQLSHALESEHVWYADFKNDSTHYIVYRNRVFRINRSAQEGYAPAREYGLALGIPDYQLDWSPDITN
jgi:hypothetical protein